jgi:hypothetical protein
MKLPLKKYGVLITVIIGLLVVGFVWSNKENFASGAYHHSNLLSNRLWGEQLANRIKKSHVKGMGDAMKKNEKKVESFTIVDRKKDTKKNSGFKQVVMGDLKEQMYSEYNPNRYVLSDYSAWEVAEEGPSKIDIHELETTKYEMPENYQKYDPKEVTPKMLNAGSGDNVSEMANAFKKEQTNKYYHDIEQLTKRGGNATKVSDALVEHLAGNTALLKKYM